MEARMKMKTFIVKSGNSKKRTGMAELEANVNEWLADHPNIVIDHTHNLAQPNLAWSHTALAIWYTES
jgi:hypothetical protein